VARAIHRIGGATMKETVVQVCPHFGDEDRDHPVHMCPTPEVHLRWTEPDWRSPARPAAAQERPVCPIEPEVRARPAFEDEIPSAARDIAALATQVYYACGYPDGDALSLGTCLTCGQRIRLKVDGDLYAHKVPGGKCLGAFIRDDGHCSACLAPVKAKKDGTPYAHKYPTIPCAEVRPVPGSLKPDPTVSILMHGLNWSATWENGAFHVAYVADPRRRRITKITELREWLKNHDRKSV
jgi:hypothetical protein